MNGTIEIANWLVYALQGMAGLLAVDHHIPVFSTTARAKAYRAATDYLAGYILVPVLLDEVKAVAAENNLAVDVNPGLTRESRVNPEPALAAEPAALSALFGC